jgi:transcriptional regulator GlxA family with amidase domain
MEVLARVFAPVEVDSIDPATQPFTGIVQDRMVAEAIRFIWSHTQRDMTVSEVVSALPVSRRSLERRFHNVLGHTLLEEITRCRVERAKRLLEETDAPLKSIASQVGFSSVQRMAKVFSRSVGVPPAAYRKTQNRRA